MGSTVMPTTAGAVEVESVDLSHLVPIFRKHDPLLFPGFGDGFGWHWHYQDYARYGVEASYMGHGLSVIEIGVRHGNCAAAVLVGAYSIKGDPTPGIQYLEMKYPEMKREFLYLGLDVECYEPGSNVVARALLRESCPWADASILSWNTQRFPLPPEATVRSWDLAHVDGDHSRDGAIADMVSLWPLVGSGGLMVVDDYGLLKDVRGAVREFSVVTGAEFRVVENQTGQAVFKKA